VGLFFLDETDEREKQKRQRGWRGGRVNDRAGDNKSDRGGIAIIIIIIFVRRNEQTARAHSLA